MTCHFQISTVPGPSPKDQQAMYVIFYCRCRCLICGKKLLSHSLHEKPRRQKKWEGGEEREYSKLTLSSIILKTVWCEGSGLYYQLKIVAWCRLLRTKGSGNSSRSVSSVPENERLQIRHQEKNYRRIDWGGFLWVPRTN